ncbi:MAG: SsrA-binding protein SmpB [Actinomycetota bacterium]|nr:SsrA-binding protein SmpB [Actinomycetota bacterium]
MPTPKEPSEIKPVATNRRARHDYHIEEAYEAGVALTGSEVKSLREGKASLQDAYATIKSGEVFLVGAHIQPYPRAFAGQNHEPLRPRKLLLHAAEIRRLIGKTAEKGYTLVPLRIYFKKNKVKVEIALAKGKRAYDKRATIAKRDAEREMAKRRGVVRRGGRT